MRKALVSLIATVTLAVGGAVAPATAANQNGLVNINVADNVVQVPVAVAANVCNVKVAVLVGLLADAGETACNATAFSGATVEDRNQQGGGGNTRQNGLINVNLENNTIQIPIAAAANICDVDVAILVGAILKNGATQCDADAGAEGIRR